ncbi:hypothetical protein D3C71_1926740 [compost metagenome]
MMCRPISQVAPASAVWMLPEIAACSLEEAGVRRRSAAAPASEWMPKARIGSASRMICVVPPAKLQAALLGLPATMTLISQSTMALSA